MSHCKCIITGCYLVHHERVLYGDLHAHGSAWIFNSVLDDRGEANEHDEPPASTQRILQVYDHCTVFERRGVLVIPVEAGRLNAPAYDYIRPRPLL